MKIKHLLLTILLAVLFGAVLPRQAQARVTFSYFYDSLQPYGDWVDVQNYGYCWQPRGVDQDWRPYTDGYWAYTDAGWTWVSYEDFGSITYHYGRWIRLEDAGWVWRPDYQWGPAWVSWRQSDDYIGWAPLPPEAEFDPDSGIGVWVDRDYDIGPSAYSFCEYRYFGAPVLRNCILPWRRNFAIINSTVNITNITFVTGNDHTRFVFNGGLDYRRISERSEHRIEMLQLMRQTDGDWAQHHRSELSRRVGTQLFVNAPDVEVPQARFAPPRVAREFHAPKIDKGWTGVSDHAERERIQQRYQDQTRGLTRATAPATAVDAMQVQSMMNETRARQGQVQQVQKEQVHQAVKQQEAIVEGQRKVAEAQGHAVVKEAEQAQDLQKEQLRALKKQQEAIVEGQRKVTEAQGHALVKEAEQTQHLQQAQQQQAAEAQRKVAEANGRAVRDQQEQAQRVQEAQRRQLETQQVQVGEQQRKAAEFAERQQHAQQEAAQRQAELQQKVLKAQQHPAQQVQPGATPDDDKRKKKHQDD